MIHARAALNDSTRSPISNKMSPLALKSFSVHLFAAQINSCASPRRTVLFFFPLVVFVTVLSSQRVLHVPCALLFRPARLRSVGEWPWRSCRRCWCFISSALCLKRLEAARNWPRTSITPLTWKSAKVNQPHTTRPDPTRPDPVYCETLLTV